MQKGFEITLKICVFALHFSHFLRPKRQKPKIAKEFRLVQAILPIAIILLRGDLAYCHVRLATPAQNHRSLDIILVMLMALWGEPLRHARFAIAARLRRPRDTHSAAAPRLTALPSPCPVRLATAALRPRSAASPTDPGQVSPAAHRILARRLFLLAVVTIMAAAAW